ncbi:MAG: 2OG-Fe(II) oxygenase [Cylindrospermopsis raciborskii KL1]|uniref:2OG-Fe(II) oxygenase n=1 Tax=Cylindrospermopsis raciborskii TaxID=77022 RepID=UPI001A289F83|nr:2OG-Fe(II) oxygenase [Cylindrospermopsis raciborskii]MBG0742047.1 2OG-Fe(II) oxygenase [Cylindrospermopsis raciborskii KL1]
MKYYQAQNNIFPSSYLKDLGGEIHASPYFTTNNLNREFIQTKGFSVVFQRQGIKTVQEKFPFFKPYLDLVLQSNCNAFYLNPLLLQEGSRVDPHIDRSLRSYCKTIEPPSLVTVLYVRVPENMEGGELVLKSNNRQIGKIKPQTNLLVYFQGNLTHSINSVKTPGNRLSLVCEQYDLTDREIEDVPMHSVESRAIRNPHRSNKL